MSVVSEYVELRWRGLGRRRGRRGGERGGKGRGVSDGADMVGGMVRVQLIRRLTLKPTVKHGSSARAEKNIQIIAYCIDQPYVKLRTGGNHRQNSDRCE